MSHPPVCHSAPGPGPGQALYPQPGKPLGPPPPGGGATWRGGFRAALLAAAGPRALASTWSEAGGRSVHGPASHSPQPAAPARRHRSLGTVPRRGSPTCREGRPEPHSPGREGDRLLPRTVSFPTHLAGHGAAWQTSRRLPGLLARSHSSSWTAVPRAESMHSKRRSVWPTGRKQGPRAQEEGSARTQAPALGRARAEGWLCHSPAV